MKKEVYMCDICKGTGYEEETMSLLKLVMSEGYMKHNSIKGMFVDMDWDLCPLCFEHVTESIKNLLQERKKA